MTRLRRLATILLAAALTSCDRGGGHDHNSGPTVVPGGPEAFAKAGSTPPVILTINIAFAENVPMASMQAFAAKMEMANGSLWNVTEGQVRIGKLRISDNAHPGSTSDQYNQLDLSQDDIVVWAPGAFNGPGIAYVLVGSGRFGHFMGVPSNIANTTMLHEFGHFLFELSWTIAPVLIDEYDDPPTDVACLMELTYTPLRWCSQPNHQDQPGQPHSCWTQILLDYPDFAYAGTDTAPAPPPAPTVEFTDVP